MAADVDRFPGRAAAEVIEGDAPGLLLPVAIDAELEVGAAHQSAVAKGLRSIGPTSAIQYAVDIVGEGLAVEPGFDESRFAVLRACARHHLDVQHHLVP